MLRPVVWRRGRLFVLDQTLVPAELRYVEITSAADGASAIARLTVRGAPAIGVTAAASLVVEARRLPDSRLSEGLRKAALRLLASRPTAVNLAWSLAEVLAVAAAAGDEPTSIRRAVAQAARRLIRDEDGRSRAIARNGAALVKRGDAILTICNTGPLAAPALGTALGAILYAHAQGKRPRVYACETRPLLQGARLTALELLRAGVDVTLIVDSAAASVVERCQLVMVGADRIARNGDTANKVGTRMLALLARSAGKPFYVAAPSSTFDPAAVRGCDITIEERSPDEVRCFAGRPVAPPRVAVFNPAFDITPGRCIAGFVTERGVLRPPFLRSIRRLMNGGSSHESRRPG